MSMDDPEPSFDELCILVFTCKCCAGHVPEVCIIVREELKQAHIAWPCEGLPVPSHSKTEELMENVEDGILKNLVPNASEF